MNSHLLKNRLISFEKEIADLYENKKIKGPIHLSANNELQLIKIFKKIKSKDWVFSGWRNHYHAILKGINLNFIKNEIIKGKSMNLNYLKKKIFYILNSWGGFAYSFRRGLCLKKEE
jgi:pyruvate dehydrogenase E1 component alpha subunit